MEDQYSLGLQYGIHSHLGHLCRFINKTIVSTTSDLLPIQFQTTPFKNLELTCDSLVPVVESCIPWFLFCMLCSTLLLVYIVYYHCVIVGKPKVICHDPIHMEALTKYCPVLFEKYRPTPWAPHAYMQTIVRVAVQTFPKQRRRREELRMESDGGHLCLDWYNEKTTKQPTVLFLPGITGSSDENYIRHWIQDMTAQGYRSIIFNYRGCGYTKLSTPRMYCGADITDLIEAVDHITTKLPHVPLIAVGVSMGTLLLIKYVTNCKAQNKPSPFRALLLISAIWNITETNKVIHRPLNKYTLNRHLCNNFKEILKENRSVFEESIQKGELCFDYHKALKCADFREFTEVLVCPMFGFESFEDVFDACCPSLRIDDIHIPILGLNAADDPFTPPHVIPEEGARRNSNLMLVTTRRGGHIGFMDSILPFNKTLMDKVLIQFTRAVFEHDAFS